MSTNPAREALRAAVSGRVAEGAPSIVEVPARPVPSLVTVPVAVQDLQPGHVYLVGIVGAMRETRRVREVFPRAMRSAVLHVEDPRGELHRAHVSGSVDVVYVVGDEGNEERPS